MTATKGIPLPPATNRIRVPVMDIGDSVAATNRKQAATITATLYDRGQRGAMRRMDDGTYRVWRTR